MTTGLSTGGVQDTLVSRLQQVVEARVQRDVRHALREPEQDPVATVRELASLADGHRLAVPVPVEPLPEIEVDRDREARDRPA